MTTKTANTWQEELADECRRQRLAAPVYYIVSDRRGGRTAWSATVTIQNQNLAARYWYDGQFLNNAKEDAAEVACTKLRNPSITQTQSTNPQFITTGVGREDVSSFYQYQQNPRPRVRDAARIGEGA